VVGEALIDEVVDGGRVGRHPGGSPSNVALGLARLDVDTVLHTRIGDDADGGLIRRHLGATGVGLTADSVTAAPTSRAVATISQDGSASYRFDVTWDPAPLADLGTPTVIHAGSLGAFMEPGSKVTRDIIQRGLRQDARITLDPNIRPSLLPDPAETRAFFEELAFTSHLTKLSDEDAEYLYPGRPLEDVLNLLIDGGIPIAAITRGADGAMLASGGERIVIPPVTVGVVDTVGAGDSFMATLIWALAFDADGWAGEQVSAERLRVVGRAAATAAALTVCRPGADLPTLRELRASLSGA